MNFQQIIAEKDQAIIETQTKLEAEIAKSQKLGY